MSNELLHLAAPSIIESFLRGSSFSSALHSFYRLHSPKFSSFSAAAEHTLLQQSSQMEFLTSLEQLMEERLASFEISPDQFFDVVNVHLEDDDAAQSIMDLLKSYEDFTSFGLMMSDKYNELYGNESKGDEGKDNEESKDASDAPQQYFLRVLWDIENVSIPHSLTALDAVARLKGYISTNLLPPDCPVEELITVFHCPSKRTLSKGHTKGLDRGGVEQVLVSEKREDADRKLVERLGRDMRSLEGRGGKVKFVVVSSDCDFVASLLKIKNAGFEGHVIHDANNAEVVKALALNAVTCQSMNEVMGAKPAAMEAGAAGEGKQVVQDAQVAREEEQGWSTVGAEMGGAVVSPVPAVDLTREYCGVVKFWSEKG